MTGFNLMILAAGYGKRMNKLTHSIPKPLLKINNKELLRHNIDFFTNLGCKKIIINTHYLHDKVQHCIERYYSDRNIIISYEPTLLNTGGGIKNALSSLGNNNFIGLKKSVGDFSYKDSLVGRWKKNDPYLYYTGLQIINPIVFKLIEEVYFSLNQLWDLLIAKNTLRGEICHSKIAHIGDINAFNQFKDN